LPAAIRESINSKYPNTVITKAEKIIQGEKVAYEVIVRQGRKRISVEFDVDGNVKPKK
jgi:hypothetical protein